MSTAVLEPTIQHTTVLPLQRERITVAEYLARDSAAERRCEFIEGEIIPMAGASRIHVQIVTNLIYELQHQLHDKDCDIFSNDTRIRASGYYYPDVGVVCGDYLVDNLHLNTPTNPTVLIEVLSNSTEHVDRGTKLRHYRRLPSLRTYLLVSQEYALVEQYERGANDEWLYTEIEGTDTYVELPSIDCRLAMAAIYRRVPLADIALLDAEFADVE